MTDESYRPSTAQSVVARDVARRYGMAVLISAVGLCLRLAFNPLLGNTVAFSTLFPAVMAAGFYGGFGPGVLATVLSAAGAGYFFMEPRYTLRITTVEDATAMGIFLISSVFISGLNHVLHNARTRAETAVENERRQRLWWLHTVASIGDGVIATDRQGNVEFLNAVAESLTGWSDSSAKGRPLDEVFNIVNKVTGKPKANLVHRVLETGTVQGLANHTVIIRRDGQRTPIADSAAPIRDSFGKIVGMILVFRDVSGAKEAEEQLLRSRLRLLTALGSLQLALEAARMGTWSRDLRSGAVEWSPELEKLFGLTPGSFHGTREEVLSLVHPDDRDRYRETVDSAVAERREYAVEFRITKPDQEVRWIEGRGRAFYDETGQPVRMMGVGIDITDRKRAEDALRRANEELEQFAFAASHDLKEPLRMVSMYMQLLSRRYAGVLDDTGQEFIKFARDGAARMQQLIDSLLEYSHIATVRIDAIGAISADQVLKNALKNLEPAVIETGARITHDPLPEVTADEIHLSQVLQNLLSNALKYRSNAVPEIHVSARPGSGEWIFSVRDNGVGIEPQHYDKIFRVFQRLHGREYPGVGVGLATCRRIVERYGGRIWVDSTPGMGSTFLFTMPAVAREQSSADAQAG